MQVLRRQGTFGDTDGDTSRGVQSFSKTLSHRASLMSQKISKITNGSSAPSQKGGAPRTSVELPMEDLGIVFKQRARVVSADVQPPSHRRLCGCLARGRVQPLAWQEESGLSQPSNTISYALSVRWRLPRFTSNSTMASWMALFFEVSGALSCAYVLGDLALEPRCIAPELGNIFERMRFDVYGPGGGALLQLAHVVNAFFYGFWSVASRVLIGREDPKLKDELKTRSEFVRSHLRSRGFWLDCISLIGLVAEILHLFESSGNGMPTFMQWIMLLQLCKMWRVVLPEGPLIGRNDHFWQGVLRILAALMFTSHLYACILMVVGLQEVAWGQESWLDQLPSHGGCHTLYTEAIYFATIGLTSVGYGDMLLTTVEKALNSVALLVAFVYAAKVCADLTWLTSTHNHWEAFHQQRRTQAMQAMSEMQVPGNLSERILAFQSYVACAHRENLDQPAFSALSKNLIMELRLHSYRRLLMQAPFLREQSAEVISLIVSDLTDLVYLTADFIVINNSCGRDLFFIRHGTASVFLTSEPPVWGQTKEVSQKHEGSYFGDLSMLTGKPRTAWIMAATYCVCSVLEFKTMEKLSKEFPRAFTILVQTMVKQYKLQASTTWSVVLSKLNDRGIRCAEEAFVWMRDTLGEVDEDADNELSAKAFDAAMKRLKVQEQDRKIFWAEMDANNDGGVNFQEFHKFISLPLIQELENQQEQGLMFVRTRTMSGITITAALTDAVSLAASEYVESPTQSPKRLSEASPATPSGFQQQALETLDPILRQVSGDAPRRSLSVDTGLSDDARRDAILAAAAAFGDHSGRLSGGGRSVRSASHLSHSSHLQLATDLADNTAQLPGMLSAIGDEPDEFQKEVSGLLTSITGTIERLEKLEMSKSILAPPKTRQPRGSILSQRQLRRKLHTTATAGGQGHFGHSGTSGEEAGDK
eukprot:TRINITY_DN81353_c0_g1_i1.p1 TRINITY_DN81353_c0_g1~~TRINITY_DN81353_c0_g1_i1.p1  ORF type:complete len:930 (+),score=194.14 TRINITY_DN81353_c0_g1_i1:160-2949(+)